MRKSRLAAITASLVTVAIVLSRITLAADSFAVPWWTTDGGGATSSSGAEYTVGCSIGQPDASNEHEGADYGVVGGFWAIRMSRPSPTSPEITIAPLSLAFGSQDVDAGPTVAQTVVITSDGSADLHISSVSLTGTDAAEFIIRSDSGGGTLAPGGTRTVQVAFDPSSSGRKSAGLTVQSDDGDESTVDVALSGTGIAAPEITVVPLSLAFGSQDVATGATVAHTVIMTNDGSADLHISTVSLTGTDAAEFIIRSDSGGGTLAPGGTRTVQVAFDPSSSGRKSAGLTVQSDDGDESTVDVALSGTGVAQGDTTAPSPVSALIATSGSAPGSIELSWIAPGDDATAGTASAYIVRYNMIPITEYNWGTSAGVSGEPAPSPAGSVESMIVSGLTPGRRYYFAIKTRDELSNGSSISNSPTAWAQLQAKRTYLPLVISGSEVPTVIPETTKVLTEETTEHLSDVSVDGATFTFSQSTPILDALEPGDVMVGDVSSNARYGFLRKVTSVSNTGGEVVVHTDQATLDEAIESGEVHVRQALTPDQIQEGTQMRGVNLAASQLEDEFYYKLENVVLYDEDGDADTKDDQIKANGSIRLEPGFDFYMQVRWFKLQELSFVATAEEKAKIEIASRLLGAECKKKKQIAKHVFAPITVAAGPFPVVLVPVLTVNVGVDGSVEVGLSTGVRQEATLRAGLRYADDTWGPVTHFSNEFHYDPPALSASLDVKEYAGTELALKLYGVTGPYAGVSAYLKLEADTAKTPWWELYGGLEMPVGVKIEVLSHLIAGYEATIIDYRLPLAQAQVNAPPNAPGDPSPQNGANGQSTDALLGWTGSDQDGDSVTYDVYFEAGDATPDALASNDQPSLAYHPDTLGANTDYYWRVVAEDEHGATNAGPVWHFVTGSSSNNPPDAPSGPSPADGATGQGTDAKLSWTGGDPDGDTVTYDVYFEAGDSSPDVLASNGQTSTTYDPGTLAHGTDYYWRIVARDEQGATNAGPVWDFTTIGATGGVQGTVADAQTGQSIHYASVCAKNTSLCDTTDEQGHYNIDGLNPGSHILEASATGYVTLEKNIDVIAGQTSTQDFALSPQLGTDQIRIVLTWSDHPADLDSHLWLPSAYPYHVFFSGQGDCEAFPYACLDRDDTDGQGPETITIQRRYAGNYVYAVKDYYETGKLTTSGALVEVYEQEGLIDSIQVPTSGDGDWWYVFDLDGSTGEITLQNYTTSTSPGPY